MWDSLGEEQKQVKNLMQGCLTIAKTVILVKKLLLPPLPGWTMLLAEG